MLDHTHTKKNFEDSDSQGTSTTLTSTNEQQRKREEPSLTSLRFSVQIESLVKMVVEGMRKGDKCK